MGERDRSLRAPNERLFVSLSSLRRVDSDLDRDGSSFDSTAGFAVVSCSTRRSAFRLSIHHSAPVASQASANTEWTI